MALESVSSALAALNRLVMTLRPVSAAKVSGRMNSSAARGHHHLHGEATLHQGAGQLRRLVRGDASADAEGDVHRSPA